MRKQWETVSNLVLCMDSPFTKEVSFFPLLARFKMPHIATFNGTTYPLDHLEGYKSHLHLQAVPYLIMCEAFITTLEGPPSVWFNKVPLGSIGPLPN